MPLQLPLIVIALHSMPDHRSKQQAVVIAINCSNIGFAASRQSNAVPFGLVRIRTVQFYRISRPLRRRLTIGTQDASMISKNSHPVCISDREKLDCAA